MRYEHYMTRPSGSRWPAHVICVDCVSSDSDSRAPSRTSLAQLLSWHAVCLNNSPHGYRTVRTACGTTPDSFWRLLAHLSKDHGGIWLLSYQCNRVWTLLQLWEMIEDDHISIVGSDIRSTVQAVLRVHAADTIYRHTSTIKSAGRVRAMQQRRDGYFVFEDPPCIARLRLANCNRWFQWVDIRNYGHNVADTVARGGITASYLATLFTQLSGTLQSLNLGSLQATAGSQALHGWRHNYLHEGVYCHADARGIAEETRGYYGGRCEAYAIGDCGAAIYHVDYRSMYPAMCSTVAVPIRLCNYTNVDCTAKSEGSWNPARCIATVTIDTDEPAYPYRHGGDVIYPTGEFTTTLCGPELCDAFETNRIVHWHSCSWYHMEYSLYDYASDLYKRRDTIDPRINPGMSDIIKRLLNCLPGKLGQRERRWIDKPDAEDARRYGTWWGTDGAGNPCRYRAIAGRVQQDYCGGYAPNAVPAVAGFITSAARVALLRAIRIAGWEHVYYVDTDSLFVNETGYTNLVAAGMVCDNVLGYLRCISGPSELIVNGIKSYVTDRKVVCAGMPHGANTDCGDGVHFSHTITPAEYIRAGRRPRAETKILTYRRHCKYRHGVLQPDGRVRPWNIEEGGLC